MESCGNKYLIFAPTNTNKEILTKYTELWDKIKNLIEKINGIPSKYKTRFMKIKLNSDDDLPLGKILNLHNMTIVIDLFFKKITNIIHRFF